LAVLFLKFRHVGLQLLVLLQSLGVLAGSQGQTQHYCHGKYRPNVFVCHTSSFIDKNIEFKLEQPIAGRGDWASVMEFARSRKPDKPA
jgi:hypothetical protein